MVDKKTTKKPAKKSQPKAKVQKVSNESAAEKQDCSMKKCCNGKPPILTLVILAVIAAGGYIAYTKGLIPGLASPAHKAAKTLEADIASLQGNGIEEKFVNLALNNQQVKVMMGEEYPSYEAEMKKSFEEDVDVSFEYNKLEASAGDGKGIVNIIAPKLQFSSLKEGMSGFVKFAQVELARDAANPNHYFYTTSGDLEVHSNGVQPEKLFAVNYVDGGSEIIFSEQGDIEYSKGEASDIKIIEGRGDTVVATIGKISAEQKDSVNPDGTVQSSGNYLYDGIEPGDMIKMMFGPIKPISIKLDYAYSGDNVYKAISEIQGEVESRLDNAEKALDGEEVIADKAEQPAEAVKGKLTLREFSIMTAGGGLRADGNLQFGASEIPMMPSGDAKLVVANYQQLIDYLTGFIPVPQEEVERALAFLMQIGEQQGDDVAINIVFDGTQNVKIGGKTLEELEQLHKSYFPSANN
ncbi:MAG: hypothetical protein COV36_04220 [Alphaproteobacteria bacterium CG11_big_fil_rev_8_21_14_0_20_44_7]|nr:MAG: hypothetical protein COV36_04220 [Alphaproteobacteria bacterium CG11_big_fil_rev_8_21_14_0_20_44_7]